MAALTAPADHLVESVVDGVATSLGDVLDLEADHMTRTFDTEDHRRAAQAFVNKQTPDFRGR